MRHPRPVAGARADQGGYSLIELLVGMLIFVVVLGATLTALDTFALGIGRNERRNETQQQARNAVDRIARQLRNLASPTPNRPEALDKAAAYDLVFQSVDPLGPNTGANLANVRRLRYCLDGSGTVWTQLQTWTQSVAPAVPSTVSCPDPDPRWAGNRAAATNVVNRIDGQNRPLWAYDAQTTADISFIRTTVIVDRSPGRRGPGESTLSTGVFLRNQNRPPLVAFTATITGSRHVLLNGSMSSDPEGLPLTYSWYDGATKVGDGITYDYLAPAAGPRSLTLRVTDPGGLVADAPAQTVNLQ